jgi:phosphatidylserine decarboxylase
MLASGSSRYMLLPLLLLASAALFAAMGHSGAAWAAASVGGLVFALFAAFFRDPERTPAPGFVSPADGRVLGIEGREDGSTHVTIFMSPHNVHVNRAPLAGRILSTTYRQGAHKPAFSKESQGNERFDFELETAAGLVEVGLIAGTVARRIHPYISAGDMVRKGERVGLIAFGSRCEVLLPPKYRVTVVVGQWIHAGSTTLATEVSA